MEMRLVSEFGAHMNCRVPKMMGLKVYVLYLFLRIALEAVMERLSNHSVLSLTDLGCVLITQLWAVWSEVWWQEIILTTKTKSKPPTALTKPCSRTKYDGISVDDTVGTQAIAFSLMGMGRDTTLKSSILSKDRLESKLWKWKQAKTRDFSWKSHLDWVQPRYRSKCLWTSEKFASDANLSISHPSVWTYHFLPSIKRLKKTGRLFCDSSFLFLINKWSQELDNSRYEQMWFLRLLFKGKLVSTLSPIAGLEIWFHVILSPETDG